MKAKLIILLPQDISTWAGGRVLPSLMEKLQKCHMEASENHSQKGQKKKKRLTDIEGNAENWKKKETWLYSQPTQSQATQAHNPPPTSALHKFSQES